eukprot:m.270271 g.270271  ORF g.270271 m.270271 type:complete len:1323 (+) comp15677_c0_seq4:246-4214(+)
MSALTTPAASGADLATDPSLIQDAESHRVETEVFNGYQCSSLSFGKPHPGHVVEAASLAAVNLPKATYPLDDSLPPAVIHKGKLSTLQLEGVMYACMRHQQLLPSGERAGFFLGDGAGVGKGRQIAGIVFDSYARGRKQHLWFSVSTDLRLDAERDLNDLGCFINVIDGCQELDRKTRALGLSKQHQEGVIFATYSTLVSGAGNAKSRLSQLVKWCGGVDFEGCLIFDECHKAKNLRDSLAAATVVKLQELLPRARVLYCSATGVTRVANMGYMVRLGLWGQGTSFATFEDFETTIQSNGLGAAEMLAMEMKAAGVYISRGLSYHDAEFTTDEASLSQRDIDMYDSAVKFWHELHSVFQRAAVLCRMTSKKVNAAYWGCHQRFYRQLCLSIKLPLVVSLARQALEAGQCVVIGLQSTGEASLNAALAQDAAPASFMSLAEEMVRTFIENNFPNGSALSQDDLDALEKESNPLGVGIACINKWNPHHTCTIYCRTRFGRGTAPQPTTILVEMKRQLLEKLVALKLPANPLDVLIDELGGPAHVAELTGRKFRVVREGDAVVLDNRFREMGSDGVNVAEKNQFMGGNKLVAIISDAASTGISLHADTRAKNTRRRVHITFELPWSADKAVQQLGRSHRSNQLHGPVYKLVSTELGGERRFASAVAKRLNSLGALTKGDRRAASGQDWSQFDVDTQYGFKGLKAMWNAVISTTFPESVTLASILAEVPRGRIFDEVCSRVSSLPALIQHLREARATMPSTAESSVKQFLNVLMGVPVVTQNLLFSTFCRFVEHVISVAKMEGRYSEGITDITGEELAYAAPVTKYANNIKCHSIRVDRGVPFSRAAEQFNEAPEGTAHFCVSKKPLFGMHHCLLAVQKPTAPSLFFITRPNTGRSPFEMADWDLFHKYKEVTQDEVEVFWDKTFEMTEFGCLHGSTCKANIAAKKARLQGRLATAPCTSGCRTSVVHILTGNIVHSWSRFANTLLSHAHLLSKDDRAMHIVRVAVNGKRIVGLRWPVQLLDEVARIVEPPRPKVPVDAVTPLPSSSELLAMFNKAMAREFQRLKGMGMGLSDAANRAQLAAEVELEGIRRQLAMKHAAETKAAAEKLAKEHKRLAALRDKPLACEPPTPVKQRLLARITKPPRTLRNYFQASPSPSSAPSIVLLDDSALEKEKPQASPSKSAMQAAVSMKAKVVSRSPTNQVKRTKPLAGQASLEPFTQARSASSGAIEVVTLEEDDDDDLVVAGGAQSLDSTCTQHEVGVCSLQANQENFRSSSAHKVGKRTSRQGASKVFTSSKKSKAKSARPQVSAMQSDCQEVEPDVIIIA